MITLKLINSVQTIEDLEALQIGRVEAEIGPRGGGVGFYGSDIAGEFSVSANDLPNKFGCGCNYLGGGVRGAIFASGYNRQTITGRKAKLLDALSAACIRVYNNVENDNGMNEEEVDGETNWDAMATNKSRAAGIVRAY
jgi:hypothetical protein